MTTSSPRPATDHVRREAALTIRTHALRQITAYTAQAGRAAVDPESSTAAAHRERAAYWACTAREAGATEQQILDAETAAAQVHRWPPPAGIGDHRQGRTTRPGRPDKKTPDSFYLPGASPKP